MRGALLIVASLYLAGCAIYKVDIPQGNVLTAEMRENLKPGMTKRQVRYVLGSPAVIDPFHPERWDYIYSLRKGSGEFQQERLSLTFSEDRLLRIEDGAAASGG